MVLRLACFLSWPGFVPAMTVFAACVKTDVDARHKAGHVDFCY